MLSLSPIELLPIISDICDAKFAAVGGMEKWAFLSDEEKAERDAATQEDIIVYYCLLFDIHLCHEGLRTMPKHASMDQLLT